MTKHDHEPIMETCIPITLWLDEQMMQMESPKSESILVVKSDRTRDHNHAKKNNICFYICSIFYIHKQIDKLHKLHHGFVLKVCCFV